MKTRGTKEFAQTASRAYKSITASQKEELRKKCSEEAQPLTVKDIKRDGRKIFKNMDKQVSTVREESSIPSSEAIWDPKCPGICDSKALFK